jgi:hypothetical protein
VNTFVRHVGALVLAAFVLAGMALALRSDEEVFNTVLQPPSGRETYRELLPGQIGGEPAVIRTLPDGNGVLGARAIYGTQASIDIVLAPRASDLDAFVREHLLPRLAAYETRASGAHDGTWALYGRGSAGRLHGWQNHAWLFVIEARSETLFNEAVDRFAFIERTRS